MKLKAYKPAILLVIVLFGCSSCIYQSYSDGRAGTDADEIGHALSVLRRGYRNYDWIQHSSFPETTEDYAIDCLESSSSAKAERIFGKADGVGEAFFLCKLHEAATELPPKNKGWQAKNLRVEKARLQRQYEQHVKERLLFLQQFYQGLYTLSPRKFARKYRYRCSEELYKSLQSTYKLRMRRDGNFWVFFTDNELHDGKDFRFSYLDGDPARVEDKRLAYYMFGDSVRRFPFADWSLREYIERDSTMHFLLDYRLSDMEHKWYKVSMGGHTVYVQVDGQGKYLTITGLANPLFCFYRRDLFE